MTASDSLMQHNRPLTYRNAFICLKVTKRNCYIVILMNLNTVKTLIHHSLIL